MSQKSSERNEDPKTDSSDSGGQGSTRGAESDQGIPLPPALGSDQVRAQGDDSGDSGSTQGPKSDRSIRRS